MVTQGLDERMVTRAIVERYCEKLLGHLDLDVAVCGAGPSGLVAAYYLATGGARVAIFERKLSIGGGLWGGGMLMNEIVVQEEGKAVLDELQIATRPYADGYYTADAVQTASGLCYQATRAGVTVFNGISVEDLVVHQGQVCGVVVNWSAVEIAGLHVDPLTVRARHVVDATGHPLEVVRTLARKMGVRLATSSGQVEGEKCMWAEVAESTTPANTKEIYPGLYVAGMSANAAFGSYRMGPIFGGMLLSGKRVAELLLDCIARERSGAEGR